MTFWRRPLHAMTDAFTAAGFRLSVVSEPQPDPAARDLFPADFHEFATRMTFLFFVVEVPAWACLRAGGSGRRPRGCPVRPGRR